MTSTKHHMKLSTAQLGTIASLAVGDTKFKIVWLARWKPYIMQWEIISTNAFPLKAVEIDKRLNIRVGLHLEQGVFAKEDVYNQYLIFRYMAKNGFIKG